MIGVRSRVSLAWQAFAIASRCGEAIVASDYVQVLAMWGRTFFYAWDFYQWVDEWIIFPLIALKRRLAQ